ncbi:5539_t:CDS:2 [Funneliformis mosseae]|uniref:5539_t:CDS:1 n=1 Tax=Funneliformis mosseae TaxID=27381 RepID=A0A9N9CN83_FUNMO|nr:5539_t:CDS:2 [Funneliformis mosseae]
MLITKFNKPIVNVSNSIKSNILNTNDKVISEFISLKATISPGISANSYIEVEKLQKLLISRKDDIDCILKSQPVYAIGIDFQKNSTNPCIACWVAEPLDITILECLENMFEDQFEIYVDSIVNAEVINLGIVQDFNITASIWANTAPFEEDVGILNYEINVNGCGIGDMLSNNWPLLKRIGFGYFLHSIEVNISPIPEKKIRNFHPTGISQPTQSNREIEFLTANEKNINLQVGTSSGSIAGINGGIKKVHNTKFSSNEWKLSYKGPNTKGERWLYQYVDNNLDKDGSNRESFAPGPHSGQWLTKKEMQGFCITITQIVRCEVTHGWRRFLHQTKPKLLQLCPMMSHSLKITFNDLKDFNANLTKLNKTFYTNNDNIYINVGGNEVENINNDENQKIKNLNGEIKRSFVIL